MTFNTLISTDELATYLGNESLGNNHNTPGILIIDCRFDLAKTSSGKDAYAVGHIPGAIYAHLDEDLSGKIIPGETGRHPLPEVDDLARLFSSWGIDKNTQVVAYDNIAGPFAARLWWMLRWMGHEKVAVLNGGLKQWLAEGRKTSLDVNPLELKTLDLKLKPNSDFDPSVNSAMLVDAEFVMTTINTDKNCLLDARPADRFCGKNETMDAKAGHIPGAISIPFFLNLTDTGLLKSREALVTLYREQIGDHNMEDIIVYCGSGVTAAHNLLAMEYCGLSGAKNYVGSWSDWITDDSRPIATC